MIGMVVPDTCRASRRAPPSTRGSRTTASALAVRCATGVALPCAILQRRRRGRAREYVFVRRRVGGLMGAAVVVRWNDNMTRAADRAGERVRDARRRERMIPGQRDTRRVRTRSRPRRRRWPSGRSDTTFCAPAMAPTPGGVTGPVTTVHPPPSTSKPPRSNGPTTTGCNYIVAGRGDARHGEALQPGGIGVVSFLRAWRRMTIFGAHCRRCDRLSRDAPGDAAACGRSTS